MGIAFAFYVDADGDAAVLASLVLVVSATTVAAYTSGIKNCAVARRKYGIGIVFAMWHLIT